MKKMERGIHELYDEDPVKADLELWGRTADPVTRRGFLKKSGLATLGAFLGAHIPFSDLMPAGLIPASLAYAAEPFEIPGKATGALTIINDRPLNAEALPHFLDDDVTPQKYLFIRNNGIAPKQSAIDLKAWTLSIEGESIVKPATFTIDELKTKFKNYTYQIQIECGGNGRSEYYPPAKGNQWTLGAIGCPEWTGVRLRDVLNSCGLKEDAVYTGYYGADTHISGNPDKVVISRGAPIEKAMEKESLIAWAANGEDLHIMNGYPLRLITGGWPASTSGKWLKKIVVRNKIHDGPKMTGYSYRVPCAPVAAGEKVAKKDMCIIESMPVKSLITYPKNGIKAKHGQPFLVRGHAWAGDLKVKKMHVSIDYGATWMKCDLKGPRNRLAWQRWNAEIMFPQKGYYEVWARATDADGKAQPMVVPGWNPKGYLNNACHRIAVRVV
ncbi:MAG TPA: molybdopterin containing oxidoreductase [Nitrospiraceae bacterium]|nr:molybdopterin containing oxidoreductase [Nitrospiraceae bacterium]